jgi:NADH-quinone oxidoreductase subunit H
LMNLGWKKLIPLAIINIIITGASVLFLKPYITALLN